MYHHTAQVPLTFYIRTLTVSLLLNVFYRNEIIVIYCLPITRELGLCWLVHDYVRCLQSRN